MEVLSKYELSFHLNSTVCMIFLLLQNCGYSESGITHRGFPNMVRDVY